jgi:hypothetical protein
VLDVFYFGEGFAIKNEAEAFALLQKRKDAKDLTTEYLHACLLISNAKSSDWLLEIGGDSSPSSCQCLPAGNGRIFFFHEFGYNITSTSNFNNINIIIQRKNRQIMKNESRVKRQYSISLRTLFILMQQKEHRPLEDDHKNLKPIVYLNIDFTSTQQ